MINIILILGGGCSKLRLKGPVRLYPCVNAPSTVLRSESGANSNILALITFEKITLFLFPLMSIIEKVGSGA